MSAEKIADAIRRAPSMAIPREVHQKYSETYGGRNTKAKQAEDSVDLTAGVNSNVNALKPGLLEYGLQEQDIEVARRKLHEIYKAQGWTE